MDGCAAEYIGIPDSTGRWEKPDLVEIYDTRSSYMFAMDAFFGESSANALCLFFDFLRRVELPRRTVRFRPDGSGGFKHLKRVIRELNLRYSTTGGFFMKPDFARPARPKDKAHLESQHRAVAFRNIVSRLGPLPCAFVAQDNVRLPPPRSSSLENIPFFRGAEDRFFFLPFSSITPHSFFCGNALFYKDKLHGVKDARLMKAPKMKGIL